MRKLELIVTCEHGGNRVPSEFRESFRGAAARAALGSHRGFDAGALEVARALAEAYGAPLVASDVTRLLVDLNRSRGHPKLYSEFSKALIARRKRELLRTHYVPYRERVEAVVAAALARGARVLHVSSHSFTPVLGEEVRAADVGLLYDPGRAAEKAIAAAWAAALGAASPTWSVRRNYPYRGVADGLTTALRRRFADADYAGLELEINQRLVGAPAWQRGIETVVGSLAGVLAGAAAGTGGTRGTGGTARAGDAGGTARSGGAAGSGDAGGTARSGGAAGSGGAGGTVRSSGTGRAGKAGRRSGGSRAALASRRAHRRR